MTRCVKCNKRVLKIGENTCSGCKSGFTDSYLRRIARKKKRAENDTDTFKYCANPLCSLRNQRMPKIKMVRSVESGMVTHFCTEECLKKFRKNQ